MIETTKSSILKIENLTKSFDTKIAVNNVSFNIESGKIYGIVGTNGSGKSTLLRLISGIYIPDAGIITINDENVYDNPDAKENLAFLPDEPYFPPNANMKKLCKSYKLLFSHFSEKKFDKLMEIFHFPYKTNILQMSKGQKRLASIILTLSIQSSILLFDESFDGLDPMVRSLVKKIIYEDVDNFSRSYIVTSHSLKELEELCDHIILFHDGKIILTESIDKIQNIYCKVQVGLNKEISLNDFTKLGLNIINFSSSGKIANVIFANSYDECSKKLNSLNPIILDINGLSLDEIFNIKAKENGYSFDMPIDF